jgi:hypothetical protein
MGSSGGESLGVEASPTQYALRKTLWKVGNKSLRPIRLPLSHLWREHLALARLKT